MVVKWKTKAALLYVVDMLGKHQETLELWFVFSLS